VPQSKLNNKGKKKTGVNPPSQGLRRDKGAEGEEIKKHGSGV
jgi:hypothetical protein